METSEVLGSIARAAESRGVRLVLVMGAVVLLLVGIDTAIVHLRLDPLADVHAYYDAGARLNAGEPLYEQTATTNDADFYRYPPFLAILFRPLALLPFEQAAVIWELLLVAMFLGTIRILGVRNPWPWLALGWLAAPIAWSLVVGQAQVAVTYFLALGSPFGVAVAAHLKVLPALVAVFWVARRDWSRLRLCVLWGLAILLFSFVLEPAGTIAFLTFPNLSQVGEVRNLSPFEISPVLWIGLVLGLLAAAVLLAPTRAGWLAAVALSVFANPRLLMYQFMTLLAGMRPAQPLADPSGRHVVHQTGPVSAQMPGDGPGPSDSVARQ